MGVVPMQPKRWNKGFIIELKTNIPYPKQDRRWEKYGEPLSHIFEPYFSGEIGLLWFHSKKNNNLLSGVNVSCFELKQNWEEDPNDTSIDVALFRELLLFVEQFAPFEGKATITGIYNIDMPSQDWVLQQYKAKNNLFKENELIPPGLYQISILLDLPEAKDPDWAQRVGYFKMTNDRLFFTYMSPRTHCRRFWEPPQELREIIRKNENI
jgi:hypothetical protein